MKELVVISGKGGTGETNLAAAPSEPRGSNHFVIKEVFI